MEIYMFRTTWNEFLFESAPSPLDNGSEVWHTDTIKLLQSPGEVQKRGFLRNSLFRHTITFVIVWLFLCTACMEETTKFKEDSRIFLKGAYLWIRHL